MIITILEVWSAPRPKLLAPAEGERVASLPSLHCLTGRLMTRLAGRKIGFKNSLNRRTDEQTELSIIR